MKLVFKKPFFVESATGELCGPVLAAQDLHPVTDDGPAAADFETVGMIHQDRVATSDKYEEPRQEILRVYEECEEAIKLRVTET